MRCSWVGDLEFLKFTGWTCRSPTLITTSLSCHLPLLTAIGVEAPWIPGAPLREGESNQATKNNTRRRTHWKVNIQVYELNLLKIHGKMGVQNRFEKGRE